MDLDISKFDDYLLANNLSNQTRISYLRTINNFLVETKKKQSDIIIDDIKNFQLWCIKDRKYESNSLIPIYSAINKFIDYLDGENINTNLLAKHNKLFKLKPPKKIIKNKTPLTVDEMKKLFQTSKGNLKDHAIINTLYYSQIRNQELVNLNLEDIDFERGKIRVNHGKGNQYREVNIHPDALKSIQEYLRVRGPRNPGEKALFLNSYGKRLGKTGLHHLLSKWGSIACINKKIYPHLFRTSSITHMNDAGATLPQIMAQSGHKDVDTLVNHYIRSSEKHNKEVYLRTLSMNDDEKPTEISLNPAINIKSEMPKTNEDKYIALLEKGLIGKDEFMALMGISNNKQSHPMFG